MSALVSLFVFRLDRQRFALPIHAVERVVHAVDVTRLPGAPPIVLGAIDVEGRVLPVLDVRSRFGMPGRRIAVTDHFLVVRASARAMVLAIDEALEVIERTAEAIVSPATVVHGLEHLQGIAQLEDGLLLIQDLERFLSLDEGRALDAAMIRAEV